MTIKRKIALFLTEKLLDDLLIHDDQIVHRDFAAYTFNELVEYAKLAREFQVVRSEGIGLGPDNTYTEHDDHTFRSGEAYRDMDDYFYNHCVTETLW